MDMQGLHTCTCCAQSKPLSEFGTQSYTGLPTTQCKHCISIKRSVVRHKAKHGKFISKEKQRSFETPDFSLADWKECMLWFRGACAYCGKPEGRAKADKMDRDHIVAISKGGQTIKSNMCPACTKCNRGRGNKDWLTWFRAQPFYDEYKALRIAKWLLGGAK